MPRINLLPIRAARLRDTLRNEMLMVFGLLLLTAAGITYWYFSMEGKIKAVKNKLERTTLETVALEDQIKELENVEQQKERLEKKLEVIKALEANRIGPARMLDELATIFTRDSQRVWLTSLKQDGNVLEMSGGAMDAEEISVFQIALEKSQVFVEVKLQQLSTVKDGEVTYQSWQIRCITSYGAG